MIITDLLPKNNVKKNTSNQVVVTNSASHFMQKAWHFRKVK